jgi:hypothetical protein
MAVKPSITPPSIQFKQVQQNPTIVVTSPQLPAFITGPCKEIVKAFDSNGNLNVNAKKGAYTQLPQTIPQSAFPSPRHNISEVTVEEDTIKAFMNFSGSVKELPINPGSAFLSSYNKATRATVRSGTSAGLTIVGTTLVFAIDNQVNANTANDVVVTFTGTNPLTPAQVCTQINTAFGDTVAEAVTLTGDTNPRVQLSSNTYGARSSVTIRGGGSANAVLGLGASGEERVEGSGFRGQEDNFGNDTLTPWIEWHRGAYFLNGTLTSWPATVKYVQRDEDGAETDTYTAAVTYGSTGTLDIKVGDVFFADGIQVNSAFIMKVEPTRFKLGTVNTTLSTYDLEGNLVTTVYDVSQVRLLTDPAPLAPRYGYFFARNLQPNSLAEAATLLGDFEGQPAEAAFILSTSAPTGPFSLAGLNLKVTVTKNGIEQDETIFVFTGGPFNDIPAVAAAISIPDVVATNSSGKLKLATVLTGEGQSIKLAANSTANSALNFSTASDTTDTGKDVEFVDMPAVITTDGNIFNLTLAAGNALNIGISTDYGVTFPTTRTHTSAGATYSTAALLAAALQADTAFIGTYLTVSSSGSEISITSTAKGRNVVLKVLTSTAVSPTKIAFTVGQLGNGQDELTGGVFKWGLNKRPKVYTTTFTSNSLISAINQINEAVGTTVAAVGGTNSAQLALTSDLVGYASEIKVISDTASQYMAQALGFDSGNNIAFGTGRPNPDAYLNLNKELVIGPEILRNPVTGYPFEPALGDLYIQYRGLRLDVSASALNAELLEISDEETLDDLLGPVTEENPLALGIFFALQNAPSTTIKALGVDEISSIYPEGTPAAYNRVIDFISSRDVFALAPLTTNDEVHSSFDTFVTDYADPDKNNSQKEMIVWINKKIPTRKVDTVVVSGLSATTPVSTVNQVNIDVNPASALLALGINPAVAIPYSSQLYLQVLVAGHLRNYSVSAVNSVNLTLRTSFSTGQNTDGFFSTTNLTEVLSNVSYSLKVRGAELLIPGSTQVDKNKVAETVNEIAQTFGNRRVRYVFPELVVAPVLGISKQIPGYYACAAYAGLTSSQPPQQPFSNLLIKGFTDVIKTSRYFSDTQLDVIAGGGVFILVNDKAGLPIYCRHQLTTDTTSLEVQEHSITVQLDAVVKLQRSRFRRFLGNRNLTQELLGEFSTVADATIKFLVNEAGTVDDIVIKNLSVNPKRKDGLILEEFVTPFYPLNNIQVYVYF